MNKKIIYGLVGIIALVVIGGGTFTAVRLLSAQNATRDLPPGAQVYEDVFDDGSGSPVTVQTVILPAEELPQRPSEASGVLARQVDNSYFVGTGSVSVNVNIVNGVESVAVDHSGPEIEVVTNRDTVFYQDITEVSFESDVSKEQTLQQEIVQVDQPESLPQGGSIQVWGQRSGDRVVAELVVFSEVR